jgi:pimeloyl-ACP methyl ester carboxylesterase
VVSAAKPMMNKAHTPSIPDTLMGVLPELALFARRVQLPQAQLTLFLYDSGEVVRGDVPLLLVHGLGDEADTWRRVLPALAVQRRVLAVDLPGFGRSDKPEAPYTVPWYAGVLLELLDVLRIERCVGGGHSLGAMVVQWLALEAPSRVERLWLLAGGVVAGEQRGSLAALLLRLPGIGEWWYGRLRQNPQAAYESLRPFYRDLDGLPQDERDFLYRRVNERVQSKKQQRAFLRTLRSLATWLPAQQKGLAERLAGCTIPTSVLWGEQDILAPLENGRALAALLPHAHLTLLAGAGHNFQQEEPGAVIAAFSDQLSAEPGQRPELPS